MSTYCTSNHRFQCITDSFALTCDKCGLSISMLDFYGSGLAIIPLKKLDNMNRVIKEQKAFSLKRVAIEKVDKSAL